MSTSQVLVADTEHVRCPASVQPPQSSPSSLFVLASRSPVGHFVSHFVLDGRRILSIEPLESAAVVVGFGLGRIGPTLCTSRRSRETPVRPRSTSRPVALQCAGSFDIVLDQIKQNIAQQFQQLIGRHIAADNGKLDCWGRSCHASPSAASWPGVQNADPTNSSDRRERIMGCGSWPILIGRRCQPCWRSAQNVALAHTTEAGRVGCRQEFQDSCSRSRFIPAVPNRLWVLDTFSLTHDGILSGKMDNRLPPSPQLL